MLKLVKMWWLVKEILLFVEALNAQNVLFMYNENEYEGFNLDDRWEPDAK